ncbi:hypothetical protein Pan258_02290 [Symmachiella dynata]|uniref:hypothetical protein n=1 Tax=Symmachiella dynata TaxID=2527995 RepID=UPI001188E421|nr:hypothetical protein [Symmachiella dynata]QDT46212.1 hypothetical protein Pan258_02290 [Symmachiella dynata]
MKTLTNQQKVELEKKIVLACGEARWNAENGCPECSNTIRLADVLIAVVHYVGDHLTCEGDYHVSHSGCSFGPNLATYDITKMYHEQTEEFYFDLYQLLFNMYK